MQAPDNQKLESDYVIIKRQNAFKMHLLSTVLSFLSFFDKNYCRLLLHKLSFSTKTLQFLFNISKNIIDFDIDSQTINTPDGNHISLSTLKASESNLMWYKLIAMRSKIQMDEDILILPRNNFSKRWHFDVENKSRKFSKFLLIWWIWWIFGSNFD